jgi:uridine phosphorylase
MENIMEMAVPEVFHLGLTRAMLNGATIAILPGAPERVPKIAELMENPVPLAQQREFHSYRANIGEHSVIVCSTGIGGPSTSIAVEELAQLGIRTFIRVGTTGAIQPHIQVGDLIVTTGAVRLDGASYHFAPAAYPAVANFDCVTALVAAAKTACLKKIGRAYHVGITAASDTFYQGQERYDTYTGKIQATLRGSMQEWQALNVLNFEMESATLFTMCSAMGLRAGMIACAIVNRTQQEIPSPETMHEAEQGVVEAVIAGVKNLLDMD